VVTKGKPTPITDEEANYMLGQASGDVKKVRSGQSYSAGDSVKVIEGPFRLISLELLKQLTKKES
jgi:transcription antitermination factor NusG